MQYRFDNFSIDPARYELRRDGIAQPVEPLVFDLLLFFARHAGRVVSREEIVDQVWEGRAISDATISSCIKSARRALGDSGDSQTIIRTIRGRGFEFRGEVVQADDADPVVEMQPVGRAPGPDPKPVLAVLPFTNLSSEVEEYFADGLTEDIITNLARFRDLRVIAGASSLRFKGMAVDLSEVSAKLNAGYIVRGNVRRAAGRVRIAVQLIDAGNGVQLWGDRYDRDTGDLFELQDEVTRTIAATLGVTMQEVALRRALTKNPLELGRLRPAAARAPLYRHPERRNARRGPRSAGKSRRA